MTTENPSKLGIEYQEAFRRSGLEDDEPIGLTDQRTNNPIELLHIKQSNFMINLMAVVAERIGYLKIRLEPLEGAVNRITRMLNTIDNNILGISGTIIPNTTNNVIEEVRQIPKNEYNRELDKLKTQIKNMEEDFQKDLNLHESKLSNKFNNLYNNNIKLINDLNNVIVTNYQDTEQMQSITMSKN